MPCTGKPWCSNVGSEGQTQHLAARGSLVHPSYLSPNMPQGSVVAQIKADISQI